MVLKWMMSRLAIASSTGLSLVLANGAIAHPVGQLPLSFRPNLVCGAQGVPYLAQSFDQRVLGIRCLQLSDRFSDIGSGSELSWYGVNQGQGGYSCHRGSALAMMDQFIPWEGDSRAADLSMSSLSISPQGPLVLQMAQGQWPAPGKVQVYGGNRREVWVRLDNPQRWQSYVGSLRRCDRHFHEPQWGSEDDWLTRTGSGWDWLLRHVK